MKDLLDFALQERYARVRQLHPRLSEVKNLIDWRRFLELFPSKETGRGRPEYNRVLMLKLLFLQNWHNLSDEELEFQVADRLSFQEFLDYPASIPDYSTVWRFRESLTEGNLAERVWVELQRQLDEHQLSVEKGVIQDAKFITASPGRTRARDEGRGRTGKTSRSRDGTWTMKYHQPYFGFKLHTKVQRGTKFVKELAVTTAKTPDPNIDLAAPDEIIYRDKAYSRALTRARGNASMKQHPRDIRTKLRNERIKKKRREGEHPFATMVRSFHAGTTNLTTIPRVYVQQLMVCFAYNAQRLRFLLASVSAAKSA